ncbi:MAG: dephospho-CoA kinase [Candidatus Nanopelagicales bacterium]
MTRVGLSGGIGSGKTTVAAMLRARGAVVVDADALAREVVEPGTPGLAAVVAQFGDSVLALDGSLDRAALAAVVFSDPAALAALEAITHPLVAERAAALLDSAPVGAVVVYDVPLLVEKHLAGAYDRVVIVDAPDDVRLERLVARGLSQSDALARMASQATRAERFAAADDVLDNSGDQFALQVQVDRLWAELTTPPRAERPG